METRIDLSQTSYLLHFSNSKEAEALLIVPNSAGYFAYSADKYGKASQRVDNFCMDLSKQYNVYYLILPGQDPNLIGKYSYLGSINAVVEAIDLIMKRHKIVGIIGMCTGGAIAVEAMMNRNLQSLPLILYNTAFSVGWHIPKFQEKFSGKYGKKCGGGVTLDCEELKKNAPANLAPIISKHQGRILQIISGNSDYRAHSQKELAIVIANPHRTSIEFPTMSDVPIKEDSDYQLMINLILGFFDGNI